MIKQWWHGLTFLMKLPLLMVVVPVLAFLFYNAVTYVSHFHKMRSQQELESRRLLVLHQKQINLVLQHALDKVQVISKTPLVVQSVSWTNRRFANLNPSLKESKTLKADVSKYMELTISEPTRQFIQQELENDFTDIVMTEQHGFNIWGDYINKPFDQRETSWWYQTITNGLWIGDFQDDYENGEVVLPFACAIKNEESDNIGVLKASFRLEHNLIGSTRETLPSSYMMIISDATQFHTLTLPNLQSLKASDLAGILQVLKDNVDQEMLLNDPTGVRRYLLTSNSVQLKGLPAQWYMGILTPRSISFGWGLLTEVTLPTLGGTLLLLTVYFLLQRSFVRPLEEIYGKTELVSQGRYNARIDLKLSGDLQPFGQKLNHMFELLQDFAQNRLDAQSVRGQIARILTTLKAVEDNNFSMLLPVSDNEWGALNSELNVLIQKLSARKAAHEKHLAHFSRDWIDVKNALDQTGREWALRETYWAQSWEDTGRDFVIVQHTIGQVSETLKTMQAELRALRDVVYSISDDVQIIKYHVREFDREVQLTVLAQENFETYPDRIKGLAAQSSRIAQKAAGSAAINGLSATADQWSTEAISTAVDLNVALTNLRNNLNRLSGNINARPHFSEPTQNAYQVMERNVETLTLLLERTGNFLEEIENRRIEILNKGDQYTRQFRHRIQENRFVIAEDKLEVIDRELSALKEVR